MKHAELLLHWYKKHGRRLPWREVMDPYPVLVSEIMLQQTQVSRGLQYFENWMRVYPNWEALAKASNAQVIHSWAGLGYNRRGLMLRDIARQVVENGVPKSEEAWMELKGVGPYTAAALAVFTLHQKTMPIDTNIRRVIGRLFLGSYFPDPKQDAELKQVGEDQLMQGNEFWEIPQAIFDLATMYCLKSPNCLDCPMKDVCASSEAFIQGNVEIPKRMVKKSREKIHKGKKYPDRIYRGRILKEVRNAEDGVLLHDLYLLVDPSFKKKDDEAWFMAMINRLCKDHFVEFRGQKLYLCSRD